MVSVLHTEQWVGLVSPGSLNTGIDLLQKHRL